MPFPYSFPWQFEEFTHILGLTSKADRGLNIMCALGTILKLKSTITIPLRIASQIKVGLSLGLAISRLLTISSTTSTLLKIKSVMRGG